MAQFNPETDIPDLNGKVFFVTGGTAGLGKETVLVLTKHNPAHVYFSGRNKAAADALISSIKESTPTAEVSFIEMDLASLASVKKAATSFLASSPKLDVLILNAGVMALPPTLTTDGYEIQFGTNHVGHALLTTLLLPTLLSSPSPRLVSLTSLGYRAAPGGGIRFPELKTNQSFAILGPWQRYGQSKLANILYARELAKRYMDKGLVAVSIHPGVYTTGLVTSLGFWNRALVSVGNIFTRVGKPEEGVGNTLWAATAAKEGIENGGYYEPVGVRGEESAYSKDAELAKKLWEWTEEELKSWVE